MESNHLTSLESKYLSYWILLNPIFRMYYISKEKAVALSEDLQLFI